MRGILYLVAIVFLGYVVQLNAPPVLSNIILVLVVVLICLSLLSHLNIWDMVSSATSGRSVSNPLAGVFILITFCYLFGALMGEMAANPTFRGYILSWVLPK